MNRIERYAEWRMMGEAHGYRMPATPAFFWRLPVVRHAWYLVAAWRVDRHYRYGIGSIGIRTGYDHWVLYGIFHGFWPSEDTYMTPPEIETPNPWRSIDSAPEGVVVETKIDDAHGPRNVQLLRKRTRVPGETGSLFFTADNSMYVYYVPTHWRYPRNDR